MGKNGPVTASRRVIFQPRVSSALKNGIDQIVRPIRATLGPYHRLVVHDTGLVDHAPELLQDGGSVARRIIALQDANADMGAMLVRHLVSRLHETQGDGTATAAVIFQAVYNEGMRYIASGGNAVLLRQHLEHGCRMIFDALTAMRQPVTDMTQLAQLAESICHDAPVAAALADIFDVIGADGTLDIRAGHGRACHHEYIDGVYWPGGVVSREFIESAASTALTIENPAIIITDMEIEDPHELIPVMKLALDGQYGGLLIFVRTLSDACVGFLTTASKKGPLRVIAAEIPGEFDTRADIIHDMAPITGAQPMLTAAGDSITQAKAVHLGAARRAWADRDNAGVVSAKGDPRAIRHRIDELRSAICHIDDIKQRRRLRERIGKLLSSSATLWIGGATESEIKLRKERAERTAEALRGMLREGVVPGGGVSLLMCRDALETRLQQSHDADQRAAYTILLKVIEAPTRIIAENAGHDPGEVLAAITHADAGQGFDVITGRIVDLCDAGILDSAAAYPMAVRSAISSAAQALTIDVLIHRRKPEMVLDPSQNTGTNHG